MILAAATVAAAGALLAAPAAAAPAPERPVASLSAVPAKVALVGRGRALVTLRNVGRSRVHVAARAGGLAVDARGRPRLAGRRGSRNAAPWLAISPRDFELPAGGSTRVLLRALVPRRAEPGDHHAVLLLSTRPVASGAVGVRMRLGVRVSVRVPGAIVRRVELLRLRAVRRARGVLLRVTLANRGNVTESFERGRLRIAIRRGERTVAVLRAARPDLLPRSTGVVTATYRGGQRGIAQVRVEVRGATARTFRVRL